MMSMAGRGLLCAVFATLPLTVTGRWHTHVEAIFSDRQKIALEDEFDIPAR